MAIRESASCCEPWHAEPSQIAWFGQSYPQALMHAARTRGQERPHHTANLNVLPRSVPWRIPGAHWAWW
jgi:hypothetical protein